MVEKITEEIQLPTLKNEVKEFVLGINEEGENIYANKIRIDEETIIILDAIEEEKIARFTIINNLWTEVASLEKEEIKDLGHLTIEVLNIQKNNVRFKLV